MQKTFIKYTAGIVTIAVLLILFINFIFSFHMLETQQFETFYAKTEQMIHTLKNNQEELRLLNESLNEDYLTRARAAAYVMDRRQGGAMSVAQMQYLADLLNVDELHMIDENGIIVLASVAEYIGMDMHDHDQTRPFIALLESDDEDAYLIQEPRPTAAIGKLMQYIGVARKTQKGIVQVGFTPTRQLEAQSRNTYDYIFSKFPTDIGEELFVVDSSTGEMLGHSDGTDFDFDADCYRLGNLLNCTEGNYCTGTNDTEMYVVSHPYEDVLLCAALPRHTLFERLWGNVVANFCYLLFIEAAVILLLSYLVRKKVIVGIHDIIRDLDAITDGNLDTLVSVGGNLEFEELSNGINTMVKKLQYENTHDALTGLFKFNYFKHLAEDILHEMPEGKLCAAVMIDLDYFKSINDTYGHDIGDHYLKSFAAVLTSLPDSHFLRARRSGDEFCLFIYDCNEKSDIEKCLNDFYNALSEHPVKLSDLHTKQISASSGYAWTKDKSASIPQLLANADKALYKVKYATKGHYAEYRA